MICEKHNKEMYYSEYCKSWYCNLCYANKIGLEKCSNEDKSNKNKPIDSYGNILESEFVQVKKEDLLELRRKSYGAFNRGYLIKEFVNRYVDDKDKIDLEKGG